MVPSGRNWAVKMGQKQSFSTSALLYYFDVCDSTLQKDIFSELNYTKTVPEDRECIPDAHTCLAGSRALGGACRGLCSDP